MNEIKSLINLLGAIVDVNSFATMSFGVEELRPSACEGCGIGAGSLGHLNIHGHGTRSRELWGPPTAQGNPTLVTLLLRRYRCLRCKHVATVRPPLLARYFRYSTAAIASALWLWSVAWLSASATREQVSPWPVRGSCEPGRWRSLRRWLGRVGDLFGLGEDLGESGRTLATRVVRLLEVRAPPALSSRERAFVGAQLR